MRQMFDASQIMKVKVADNILKGLDVGKSVNMSLADFYSLMSDLDVLKYKKQNYFNQYIINKEDFEAGDEAVNIYSMPLVTTTNVKQTRIEFSNDPDTNKVTVAMYSATFSKA